MGTQRPKGSKGDKLKSALRENLKKRKQQTRKLGDGSKGGKEFSVKLRNREISTKKPE
ncbi:MAG: hypothetical protein ACR2O3_12540 [Rhizobiaceae bacterium]